MLFLSMHRGELGASQLPAFAALKLRLAEIYRPLLRPALEAAGKVLGVAPELLRRTSASGREFLEPRPLPLDGEIFSDGTNLIVLSLDQEGQSRSLRARRLPPPAESTKAAHRVAISVVGPDHQPDCLGRAVAFAEEVLGITTSPFVFKSERFNALKAEGRESPLEPSEEELKGAQRLSDRPLRALALAIKSSGGLLVRDLPKQLPSQDRSMVEELTDGLKEAGLIESEIVIVCSKTQAQVTRAPSREVLGDLSSKGLKCACGRPLADERMEEALAVTDLGRSLLDKARWLTVLLTHELRRLGIGRDAILVEQTVGGDEIDCLANISGELTLFELKDKEFSLGNAYSFGAKIGITRPEHPVIFTTERVGNDAREHFVRAGLAGGQQEEREIDVDGDVFVYREEDAARQVTYIEGVDTLRGALEQLISSIYRKDAASLLNGVVPLAVLDGHSLLRALEEPVEGSGAVQQRDAADGASLRTERRR